MNNVRSFVKVVQVFSVKLYNKPVHLVVAALTAPLVKFLINVINVLDA